MDNLKFTLVETVDDAQDFLRWLGERHEHDLVAFDVETGGFQPWRDKLRLVQFGDTHQAFAIPYEDWRGVVKAALSKRPSFEFVGHHSKFDGKFLEHSVGLSPWTLAKKHGGLVRDSMLAAHVLAPDSVSLALKDLGVKHIDRRASQLQRALTQYMESNKYTWATVPVDAPLYWGYACYDTILTARLHQYITSRFVEDDWRAYDLECAVSPILGRMETEGVEIDQPLAHQKIVELEQYVQEAQAFAASNYGIKNIGSNQQVIAALVADGVTLTKHTASGGISLDAEVLESLDHPIAQHVQTARKSTKLLSTYLRKVVDPLELDHNGRVHCSIKQVGARTGRMSITDPPLQTQPRGSFIREIFRPSDGYAYISADFSQIELRILAHYSQDPELLASFASDDSDPHTESARRLYRDATLDKGDPRRQTLKNTVFAYVYGAGQSTLAKTAGLSLDGIAAWIEHYDDTFKGVKRFKDTMARIARTDGELRCHGGRRQIADAEHVLTNHLIQGTAGEIFKRQLVELDSAGLCDGQALIPIHDEIIFEVPDSDPEDRAVEIVRIMSDRERFAVPILAEATVLFNSWGDKYR